MLNKQPSYAQERAWLARVAQYGCVIHRVTHGIQLHHPLGREAKKNKLYIGRRFVFGLSWDLHDIYGEDPNNVTNNKNGFIEEYGKQSDNYYRMCMAIKKEDGALPFDDEVLQAIMDTNA